MLLEALIQFSKRNEKYAKRLSQFLELQCLKDDDYDSVSEILGEFLLDVESTEDVADAFPQLLPALLAAGVSMDRVHSDDAHKLNCIILGKLVNRHGDLQAFTLHYFDSNPAPFESVESDFSPSQKRRRTRRAVAVSEVSDYAIVKASYEILKSSPLHFKYKWNWSKFYKYLNHHEDRLKWVALKCIAVVLGMSETMRLTCANNFLTAPSSFVIDHEELQTCQTIPIDTQKIERLSRNQESVTSIGGVLLPVFNKPRQKDAIKIIPVPSTWRNLRNLALAVCSGKCICLQGPVGSGKTTLVEYLAQETGHDSKNFVKIQLGEQTDSKMLLGMYRCTDIPGEFVWQAGILTEAVQSGKWLLLEDIDSAATDVSSVLGSLVENGTLCVPGFKDSIRANSGFKLFVTRRLTSGANQASLQAFSFLKKHCSFVNMEPLCKEELVTVVQSCFPILNTAATRIVDVFLLFSVGNHEDEDGENLMKTGRQTSTRDLMKWCSRAIVGFEVSSPDSALKIFQDALDLFCCCVSDRAQRLNLAVSVAHKLGIIGSKAEYFINVHKPSLTILPDNLTVGRTILRRQRSNRAKLDQSRSSFSFTRPSMCLLERISCCVTQKEPVLLVGETGTGKTSSVQYLAHCVGQKLVVINMNQQSESADLLGGYKPVDLKFLISPIREEFEILFRSYFAVEPNRKFLNHIGYCYKEKKWKMLSSLMSHSAAAAIKRLKSTNDGNAETLVKWEKLSNKLEKLKAQVKSQYSLAFSFIEGSLVKALKNGDWVLLDEINLATAETLECLSGLLESSFGSLSLFERGDKEPLRRHEDFALFACMNPATDVGKKDLPVGLRNRFTEFFVDELTEVSDLQLLVSSYLQVLNLSPERHEKIVKFYLKVRTEAHNNLLDGTGHKPHYSLRTLCRALSVSAQNPCGNVHRSLHEAFSLSFLTQLASKFYPIVRKMIEKAVLEDKTAKAVLKSPIPRPRNSESDSHVCFEGYWIPRGNLHPQIPENYILTESVRRNLRDLVRVVSIGKIPVLLQGDTSVGKTSLITYLAKASGHNCVRINNHEHTDLQEYVGSYVADVTGKLVFKEGVLVDAMRKGYWIILDELNLAPSDVLEALNRVLDDNRELFVPETQQVVKAHENFMLFATQNPPGVYGGRKVLSRAFRNRFVELHFGEIPPNELQIILHKRCQMPETYCKQVINVMSELQVRRKGTATFAGKEGFITLRDLFRWAERYRLAPNMGTQLYDWSQHLADEGYLVLSSKVRRPEEASEIIDVLKKHLKRDVDPNNLFSLSENTSPVTKPILESLLTSKIPGFEHVVWTYQMRKLAVLLKKSCSFLEPVLLIGETGGGKTTVCQLFAQMNGQELSAVNCHMHTESADFLGSLRPVRERGESQKLFEWVDGPLVNAMKEGGFFLADEISLADDSVLERLNSLLEPERELLISEKPSEEEDSTITAHERFIFVGTMNPGGDYGKKELSPALRNRFTEVWCEGCVTREDLRSIIEHNLRQEFKETVTTLMLDFFDWLKTTEVGRKLVVSVRDVLTWVNFMNHCSALDIGDAFYHGACLSFVDGLGSGLTGSENPAKLRDFKDSALKFIEHKVQSSLNSKLNFLRDEFILERLEDKFGIHPFYIEKGPENVAGEQTFAFSSPTTKWNTLKLLRALQLRKPILLEGSPGVGKTSLVCALAKASGNPILRLNLSDQTDISDLFGADLPVEGGKPGEFSWRDGPFLRALKSGDWILLDELNLASQSVLEGLNACFDHRGEVYIPELSKTFHVKPETRLFACQNPLRQGGARRGLPKSFLNRFTQVYVDALEEKDFEFILQNQFPDLPEQLLHRMIAFNAKLSAEVGVSWAFSGAPWEMNLRDICRWCEAVSAACKKHPEGIYDPGTGAELIYISRMRTSEDKERAKRVYEEVFSEEYPLPDAEFSIHVTKEEIHLGNEVLERTGCVPCFDESLLVLREQKTALRNLVQCINMNWMCILVGGPGSGKSSLIHLVADLAGQQLKTVVLNSATDTTEILGGFEQTDYNRHFEDLFGRTETVLMEGLRRNLKTGNLKLVENYHGLLENVRHLSDGDENTKKTMSSETELFLRKVEELSKLVLEMKCLSSSSELDSIGVGLRNLSDAIKEERCLNAGGKFEWVDSVFVQCLRSGTWLFLDQVNLCSPAVLDRLNGLLEPNGALTIGEKGVDKDGKVVTIKPHPNFRLFLTMDPRFGEISRAMRNRGVEISVLSPRHISEYNQLDLRSLLHASGLKSDDLQNCLLRIHQELSAEKFGMTELLQAALLTGRQISRGFEIKESFENACREIYTFHDRKTRDMSLREIEKVLGEESNASEIDFGSISLTTGDLKWNSKLAVIRQEGFLLKNMLDSYRLSEFSEIVDFNFTNALFGESISLVINVQEFLQQLLLDFYKRSSLDDLRIRNEWLLKLSNTKKFEELKNISEILCTEIEGFDCLQGNDELPFKNSGSIVYNNLAIVLYLRSMILNDDWPLANRNSKKGIMSLEEYSSAVTSGKLMSHLKEEPLITNYFRIVQQSEKAIKVALRDASFPISNQKYVELRENLKWLQRFKKLGSTELIDKSRKLFFNLQGTSSNLKVHFKWLEKFLRKSLTFESGQVSVKSRNEVKTLFEMLSSLANVEESQFRKLRKRARKVLRLPEPHLSTESMEFHSKTRGILKKLEIKEEDFQEKSRIRGKMIFLRKEETMIVRKQLVDILARFYNENQAEFPSMDHLLKIENLCTNAEKSLVQEFTVDSPEFRVNSTEFRAWPIYEFIFIVMVNCFQRKLCEKFWKDDSISTENNRVGIICDEKLLNKLSQIPTIPVNSIGLIKSLNSSAVTDDRKSFLFFELLISVVEFARRSFVARNDGVLSYWRESSEKDAEYGDPQILQTDFIGNSTLLSLIVELIFPKVEDKNETLIKLESYQEQRKQLEILKNLLWQNAAALNSPDFDLSLNDLSILQSCADYYLSSIDLDLLEKDVDRSEKSGVEICLLGPIKKLKELQEKLRNENNSIERGNGWMILGYLQLFLFNEPGPIDPVRKVALKLKYLRENICDLQTAICIEKLQSSILGTSLKSEEYSLLRSRLGSLTSDTAKFENFKAVRPETEFSILREEVWNFSKNIGSLEMISRQIDHLSDLAARIQDGDTNLDPGRIQEAKIWRQSIERFAEKLERNYLDGFPDLVFPIISGLASLRHGVSILIQEVCRIHWKKSSHDEVIYNLTRFPVIGPRQETFLELVKSCLRKETQNVISGNPKQQFEMMKIGLKELETFTSLTGKLTAEVYEIMKSTLKRIRILWSEQEVEKEERLKEEESLYRKKEIEEDEEDYQKTFPGFQEDFSEESKVSNMEEPALEIVTLKDAEEIFRIHANILKNTTNVSADFAETLMRRFELIRSSGTKWPEDFSGRLSASLSIVISRKSNLERPGIVYDFYKDSNFKEVQDCQTYCQSLRKKVNEFLAEWPENPLLISIESVINRILSFDVESPLSRFVTGFEMLISKIHQWEENAHSDVSLAELLEFFSKKILSWRKLEASRWKDSLAIIEHNLKSEAARWWFFLFDLVEQFLQDSEVDVEDKSTENLENFTEENRRNLIGSLERFLSSSSLVQFETRLQLIFLFYVHLGHCQKTKKRQELSSILFNIYQYYNRFNCDVQKKIKSMKEPIERKMRDAIKISKWSDSNYWAVKETTEKTRRVLHKLIREYRKLLMQNVASCLVVRPSKEPYSSGSVSRDWSIKPSDFVLDVKLPRNSGSGVRFRRARRFCEEIISKNPYSEIREMLENFLTDVLEDSQKLRNLEIDNSGSRKSQAKSILQRKRLALANYFKSLRRIGVSYRIGVLKWKNKKDDVIDFTCAALNLPELLRLEETSRNRVPDGKLVEQWSDCDKYYYESLIKLNAIEAILNSAKTDLGPQNAERCRGFSIHLIAMAHEQKRTIASLCEHFLPIRMQVSNLADMADDLASCLNENRNSLKPSAIMEVCEPAKVAGILNIFNMADILESSNMPDSLKLSEIAGILESLRMDYLFSTKIVEVLVYSNMADSAKLSNIVEILETVKHGNAFFLKMTEILKLPDATDSLKLSKIGAMLDIFKAVNNSILSQMMEVFESSNMADSVKLFKIADIVKSSETVYSSNLQKMAEVLNSSKSVGIKETMSNVNFSKLPRILRLPVQATFQSILKSSQELLTTLLIDIQQIRVFLENCPTESFDGDTFSLEEVDFPILKVTRDSQTLNNLLISVTEMAAPIKKTLKTLNSCILESETLENSGHPVCFHFKHYEVLNLTYQKVQETERQLLILRKHFTFESREHPITESIDFLVNLIKENTQSFKAAFQSATVEALKSDDILENYKMSVNNLVEQVLIVIQEKVRASNKHDTEEDPKKVESAEEDDLEENAFTEKLVGSLKKDIHNLRVEKISQILKDLFKVIRKVDEETASYCMRLLLDHLPLLEQYSLLVQYFLNEQVASFRLTCKFLYLQLNVFLDLAANGFCVPKDLNLEEDNKNEEGETQKDAAGGMGLAEGEGQNDVSDRIETEDQLEDARKQDDEKMEEKEDEDSKEEEKGIDMSENFDSKLQDLEKNEEEEAEEEDTEDLDKEMGETEENADKLDEELWGDDAEEDDEEKKDEENQPEEKGDGKEMEGEEMSAKENEGRNDDKREDEKGEEKEEQKKDINEFEEPEVDDDHVDPYHGRNQPEVEPEPLDLPEDMNLDDEDAKEDNQNPEENPFDIDQMKEPQLPEEKEAPADPQEPEEQDGSLKQDSTDDEEENAEIDAEKQKETSKGAQQEETEETEEKEENDAEEEEEEARDKEETAQPSFDTGSKELDASEEMESKKDGSKDVVQNRANVENEENEPPERDCNDKSDKGTGQSEAEEKSGHSGTSKEESLPKPGAETTSRPIEKRRKPGKSDENRSLLDDPRPRTKKLKMAAIQDETPQEENEDNAGQNSTETDIVEHIGKSEKYDDVAMDAATEDQLKEQASNIEEPMEEENAANEDIEMHEDESRKEEEADEDVPRCDPTKMSEKRREKSSKNSSEIAEKMEESETKVEVEGDVTETTRISRGADTSFHTNLLETDLKSSAEQIQEKRFEIEKLLSRCAHAPTSEDAANTWSSLSSLTETAARDLSEKLRLVLEPTQSSRLKGDYRTGRRINMRKIIPYIASEFRKDKIWLRRTKPSKRDYQIVLAIDDSSSMADNHSKELAFESLSLIGKAMTYLEVGQLCVINFGEHVNILHPLGDNFTEESGARLIQEMKFEQKKTMIGQLVDFTVEMFAAQPSTSENAKLLTILSDGRGIFSEGIEKVNSAVRRAKLANIFLVFIIVDNPLSKDSILDVRMPVFENGKLLNIQSYMDSFPFPFYIILRDLNMLPGVLSDALRQWFEIVGKIDT